MDVKKDTIEVVPRTMFEPVGGARPEPEELAARRVLEVDAPANLSGSGAAGEHGQIVGSMTARVVYEDVVETMAQGVKSPCHACRFFNHKLWVKTLLPAWQLHPIKKHTLNALRARFLSSSLSDEARSLIQDNENDIDIEAGLQSMGVCDALTEVYQMPKGEYLITHPLASCPSTGPDGEPFTSHFVDRDATYGKMGAALYDGVMRLAQGRAKK